MPVSIDNPNQQILVDKTYFPSSEGRGYGKSSDNGLPKNNNRPRYDCEDADCKKLSYYDPLAISPISYRYPSILYPWRVLLGDDLFIWVGENMSYPKMEEMIKLLQSNEIGVSEDVLNILKNAIKNGIKANDIVFYI